MKLYEDLFLGNKKNLEKVERILDDMLIDTDYRNWEKILKRASIELNKLFNVNLNIYLTFDDPCYIMHNVLTQDIVDEYYMETKSVVVDKDFGYKFIRNVDVDIEIEYYSFKYIIEELDIKGIQLKGSHILACILHEIGHSIYLPFEYKENSYGEVWFKTNGNLPDIVLYPEFTSKFSNTLDAIKYTLFYPLLCLSKCRESKTPLFLSISKFNVNSKIKKFTERREEQYKYNKSERNADSLPFQYGYGKEIIELAVLIEKLFIFGNGKFRRSLDNFVKGNETKRTIKNIIGMIDHELKNKNNNSSDIKFLEELKKDYKNRIKKIIKRQI